MPHSCDLRWQSSKNQPSKLSPPTDCAVPKVETSIAGGSQADDSRVVVSMAGGFDSSNGDSAIMSILHDHFDRSDPTILPILRSYLSVLVDLRQLVCRLAEMTA